MISRSPRAAARRPRAGSHDSAVPAAAPALQLVPPAVRGVGEGEGQRLEHCHDVLFHRQFSKDRGLLGKLADARAGTQVHRYASNVGAIEHHLTGVRLYQADNDVEGSSLASAVWTQQAHNLALANSNAHSINNLAAFIRLCEVNCREFWHDILLRHAVFGESPGSLASVYLQRITACEESQNPARC